MEQEVMFLPSSDWRPPESFPDTFGLKSFAIDLETKDPKLKSMGSGEIRGDGFPVGIAYSDSNFTGYYPFGHEAGGNMDRDTVLSFFGKLCENPEIEKIGHNIVYDISWLKTLGIKCRGPLRDTMTAEALIDEELTDYSLNGLANRRLGESKDDRILKETASAYGLDPKQDLWQLHAKHVGSYAEFDASATFKIYESQRLDLSKQKLWEIYELECKLIPLLVEMRFKGVPVNLGAAKELSIQWEKDEKFLQKDLDLFAGQAVDFRSGPKIAEICERKKISFPQTAKGNPSFKKEFLEVASNLFLQKIYEIRQISNLRKTFLNKRIMGMAIDGKIHCEWKPTKREDGGTKTGRFSASNPPLQQIPKRNKKFAHKIRELFIPDQGKQWLSLDYAQQEPRILVHYAYLLGFRGAEEAKNLYCAHPETDFYSFTASAAGIERNLAKTITLGRCYGLGIKSLSETLNIEYEEAEDLLNLFDDKNPFIKELTYFCQNEAKQKGYIKTILGRRKHFDKEGKDHFKAINALIQGSAADMTKKAMLDVWDTLKLVPYMQVHDELSYGVNHLQEANLIKVLVENCLPQMEVPMITDMKLGDTW
tara:strand:- start:7202 stop:8980 length:1779 start_codon:yes stop_codon:yes gene_type:complete